MMLPYAWRTAYRLFGKATPYDHDEPASTIITRAGKEPIPPMAPYGYMEIMRLFSTKTTHQDLLEIAHSLKASSFFVYRIKFPWPTNVFIVGDPSLARAILNDITSTKPAFLYATFSNLVGGDQNLISWPNQVQPRWKHARKAIAVALSSKGRQAMMNTCHDVVERWIQDCVEKGIKEGDGNSVILEDVCDEILHLTIEVICKTAFGYDVVIREEQDSFLLGMKLGMAEMPKTLGNPIRATFPSLYPEARQAADALSAARQVSASILKYHRQRQESEEGKDTTNDGITDGVPTILSCIINSDAYVDDEDRIRDITVFLLAGHDTTAFAITWALLELARHPDVQNQLRTELSAATTKKERVHVPYLKYVVKEALRLRPVSPLGVIRTLERDFTFDSNDETGKATYRLPKGSLAFTPHYLLHHNPAVFERPEEFIPSRWDTTTTPQTDPTAAAANDSDKRAKAMEEAFIPFSSGPRNCVGMPLAQDEEHYVLARLVMDYDIAVVDPGTPECTATFRPTGLKLKLTRRGRK